MTRTFIFLFLLLPCIAFGQFTISGRVLNYNDAQPVANVNVFLNNTTIGKKTAIDGFFTLQNLRPGKYDLTVSIIGFFTYSETITVSNANIKLSEIYLNPKVTVLNEVKITSKEDPDRQRNLDLFMSAFLGTSDFAKECKLINPELLDLNYDEKTKRLKATSVDFLIIENHALGYRIKYLLSDFDYDQNARQFLYEGSVFFEELKGTSVQEEQWQNRRQEVYANSITHFLRAALNNKLSTEGFGVLRFLVNPERPADTLINSKIRIFTILKDKSQYRDSLSFWIKKSKLPKLLPNQAPVSLTSDDIIENTNKPGLYAFGCSNDALYVIYNKARQYNATSLNHLVDQNNTSSTLVTFNAPFAFFDSRGALTNPESLTFAGVWANKKIAELLPINYEPPPTEPPVDSVIFKKIDSTLKTYTAMHRIEKAYLHFDKPYYAAGDTIYFKAYVISPPHEPSVSSKVLNAELISSDNKICAAVKLKLTDGIAAGDFALSDSLKNGYYRLRAYTNILRNEGEEYFFDQYLSIVNTPAKVSLSVKKNHPATDKDQKIKSPGSKTATNKIDVQFFPEGGTLVNGLTSKIAFKAVAQNGLGIEIKGTITDEQGRQVGAFASQHLGMGILTITPQAGKRYKANITDADSIKATFDLPLANDADFVMNIDNSDPRNIKITTIAGQQNYQGQLNLIAQSGGIIYAYAAVKLINRKFTTVVPKNIFPGGIVQFTLFSAGGEPMNERLVFIRNPNQLNLKIATTDSIYHARQKVKINFIANDENYQPVAGNFSAAVTDETRVPVDEDNESTILSHLLLTADLKGYVERPNYYFTGKNDKANEDLDVLMLTQGYHRFEWKQILNSKIHAVAFEPEAISTVSGKITNLNGKPVPYGKVSLTSLFHVFFSLDTVADASGKFVFNHLPQMDSMRYLIQATDKQVRKNTLIEIDKVNPPKMTGNNNAPDGTIKESDNLVTYLKFSTGFHQEQLKQGINKHAIMLKEVTIKEKKQKKYLHHSDNLNGAGVANEVITADQLPLGCPVLVDCILGRLHGIKFVDGTPFYGNLYGHMETAVFIDGVEITGRIVLGYNTRTNTPIYSDGVSKEEIINMLSVNDIASIEIITDASLAAIYGVRGGGGVILITTLRGDDMLANVHFQPAFAYYTPVGYYKARVFYSPKYDFPKINTTIADLRTTIYWNPNMSTDKNGNASFEFFNADTKGTYRIVVEGIDGKGHLGRQVYHYKVE